MKYTEQEYKDARAWCYAVKQPCPQPTECNFRQLKHSNMEHCYGILKGANEKVKANIQRSK